MAVQPNASVNSSGPDLEPIRKPAMDAVAVMFNRAIEIDPDAPVIEDKKTELQPPLPSKGALQDSEFGMMLLLARTWMGQDLFTAIDSAVFERVIAALVKGSVNRVLDPLEIDDGGGGDHVAFFTGEPYSKHTKSGPTKYSANLDAAMITVAFLALAVEQFNDSLNKDDHGIQSAQLPPWVKSLRDTSLFVIGEGLKYALECRVIKNDTFQGFTCDPDSNRERPEDGYLKREDRLFFTWTACETINDLTEWRETYLDKGVAAEIPEAVSQLKSLITELEGTLRQSAQWCATEFLEEFQKLEAKDAKELVKDVNQLKGRRLNDRQKLEIADLTTSVQHVYQLSQYAAIRSLVPKSVTLQEVRTILDKIDLLVSRSILGSGLDDSDQPDLFLSLTRKYSLGKWDSYSDDAWYPLVVRSLSGLLSRTLRDIGEQASKPEVLALTLTFERTLENHVKNLLDRHPSGGGNISDSLLWSFAAGQPYVFYATQRTIFALMKYEDFLVEVDQFKVDIFDETPPDVSDTTLDLPTKLARRLGEDFLKPMIIKLLGQIPRSEGGELLLPSTHDPDISLPEEQWARSVICKWLEEFNAKFEESQVKRSLSEKANWLNLIRETVERYEPTKDLNERKKRGVDENLLKLKDEYKRICTFKQVGKDLSLQPQWGVDELTPILFDYLFRNCVQKSVSSIEEMSKNSTDLWKLIKDANDTRDTIKNLDPTGVS